MREAPLEPYVNEWEEYLKPKFIEDKIFDIAYDIMKKGERSQYKEAFLALYMHISDNIEKYIPEPDVD